MENGNVIGVVVLFRHFLHLAALPLLPHHHRLLSFRRLFYLNGRRLLFWKRCKNGVSWFDTWFEPFSHPIGNMMEGMS
jgi:hypothetical protein